MWSATKTISASGFGFLAILFDGRKFFLVRAAAKEILHAAHKKNLKRRHQRGGAGTVENFGQVGFRKIEFEEAEVAEIGGNQVLEDGIAKALAKEGLIAHEHVGRTQLARFESR